MDIRVIVTMKTIVNVYQIICIKFDTESTGSVNLSHSYPVDYVVNYLVGGESVIISDYFRWRDLFPKGL